MSRRSKKQRDRDQGGDTVSEDTDECSCNDDSGPGCFIVFLICFLMWSGCQVNNYVEKRAKDAHEIELKKLEIEHLKLKGEAK